MRKLVMALGAAASLFVGSAATAQDKPVASKSDVTAAQNMQRVAHCVAEGRSAWSHDYVTMDYRTKQYRALGEKLGNYGKTCPGFSRGLVSSGLVFAGAVAEGLLIDKGLVDDLAAATAYDPDMPPMQAYSGEDVFAYCVIRKDAAGVAALLKTQIVSDDEMTALKALVPVLPTCVPEGETPKFTREALRALFALAAYRLHAHNVAHAG